MINDKESSDNTIKWLILGCELFIINLGLVLLFYIRSGEQFMSTPNCKRLMLLLSISYALSDLIGVHKLHSRFVRGDELLKETFMTLLRFTVISLLILWTFRWPLMTKQWMLPFFTSLWAVIALFRWSARMFIKWYRRLGRNSSTLIFVGNVNIASNLIKRIEKDKTCGYVLKGYFAKKELPHVTDSPYLGKPEDVLEYIEKNKDTLQRLCCMLPSSENTLINKIIASCENNMVRYLHIPDSFNYQRHKMSFEILAGTPVFNIHNEPLMLTGNRILKRGFDILFSLLVLTLIFPWIYIIFGTLIKRSSPGPIIFKQKRSGIDGKEFWCLKFRSMKVNNDSDKLQATKNDPRKTRVGEFIRKTSIDEFPQFINVLKGEMSVVGPRPHMIKHTQQYSDLIGNYMVRHYAKPGITGHAQVTGSRGETKELWQMEERVKKDIWYIENWSLALDIFIIFKTIANAIRGEKEAY